MHQSLDDFVLMQPNYIHLQVTEIVGQPQLYLSLTDNVIACIALLKPYENCSMPP